MTKAKAIEHFGSATKLASAVGVTKQTVSQWGEYPPGGRQFQLQIMTKGKLKAEAAK